MVACEVFNMPEKLKKSIRDDDWKFLKSGHVSIGHEYVNHVPHMAMTEHVVPKELHREVLQPDKVVESQVEGGISPKAVFDTSAGRVMIKPYHRVDIDGVAPLFGWASVAVPHLYRAGGIEHLVDKVGVTEHQGIPFTVHPFEQAAEMYHGAEYLKGHATQGAKVSHIHDFGKIAIMDFLTNNTDRHLWNFLIKKNHKGELQPVAIDNERSLLYSHNKSNSRGGVDSLSGYWGGHGGVAPHIGVLHGGDMPRTEVPGLAKWWMNNAEAIKTEFHKHLSHLTNDDVRRHVEKNFHDRHKALTEAFRPWAEGKGTLNPFMTPTTARVYMEGIGDKGEMTQPERVGSVGSTQPTEPKMFASRARQKKYETFLDSFSKVFGTDEASKPNLDETAVAKNSTKDRIASLLNKMGRKDTK
jgi:hypothetical protein